MFALRFEVLGITGYSPARVTLFLAELRNVFRISSFEAQYSGAAPRHPLRVDEAT